MICLLHDSIRDQANLRPSHIAFRCRDKSIAYSELFQRSNQLANFLLANGVRRSDRVGIFLSKSIETPFSLYGILAAGCAFVPIDPTAPIERVDFILRNCGIEFLITDRSKIAQLQKLSSQDSCLKRIIGIPENSLAGFQCSDWDSVFHFSSQRPEPPICESDLAYVMYTSGSTGQPKGLMHTHASGLAYARRSAELYSVCENDILGNHAPLHFDISTFDFLTGPLVGATTVLIPEEAMLFPASLSVLIQSEGLTFWYSVPLALIQLLTRGDISSFDLSSLRWVLFGGEPFPPKYLRELMDALPNARFCNVYGPAEVNQCTYFHVPEDFDATLQSIPLGYIWPGARALITDEDGNEVGYNGTGELLIHSTTMMRAYWGKSEQDPSAFYFRENELGLSERYYRTGDLVSMSSNGILEFVGRRDRQVKLRGYRLELDEVEAVFSSYPEVEEAAAIVRLTETGEKELAVLIIPNQKESFDTGDVLRKARLRLPAYGVPSQLETRESFPRTTSGKIDRKKLESEPFMTPLSHD